MFIYNLKESFFAEHFRWFLWSPVLFAIGIGIYFSLPFEVSKWIVLLLIEFLLILTFIFRYDYGKLFVLLMFFLVALGFATACLQTFYISKNVFPTLDGKLYITGRITALEHNYNGKQRLVLEDVHNYVGEPIKGKYKLTITYPSSNIVIGNYIEAVAVIAPPTKPFLVGGYQPQIQAFFEEISGVGYIPSRVLPIDNKPTNSFSDYIGNFRQKISNRINEVLPKDQAAIITAISTGDRGEIKVKIRDNYRDAGLAHFLSISGLHMSMIAGLMFFFIRFILVSVPNVANRVDTKKISAIIAIVMSAMYLMISGAEIPAQRAFIMTTIVLLGVLLDRTAISMRILAISVFVVLTISPHALIGPSFQMSFSAVIALVAFYEKYAGSIGRFLKGDGYKYDSLFIKFMKICWVYIIGILLTDLVASVTTSIFALYHFNRLAIYTTLGNMLSGPIIGFVIMPFLLLSLLLMPIGLDYIPLKITGWGVGLVNDITKDVALLPHASVQLLAFPTWSVIFMTMGGLWVCVWQQKWRKWGWVAIIVGFLGIFTVSNPDIIINGDAKAIAVKDSTGDMVVLPSRGNYTLKKVWREKTASRSLNPKETRLLKQIYEGEVSDSSWLNLNCNDRYCDYKQRVRIYKSGKLYDLTTKKYLKINSGGNVYINDKNLKAKTIDEYIGDRVYSGKNN